MRRGFPQSRFAIGYIALGMVALAMFAILLWYGYRTNLGTFRAYVPGAEMQRLVEIFHRDGARAVADAVDAYLPSLPRDELILFVDPEKQRLAGSLPAWPAELPDVPGTYGVVIGTHGAAAPMRVVTSHITLPGGYALLMGRESVRFQSLIERFWYGIVAAMAAVLALGALIAWRSRRALAADEQRFALAVAGAKDGVWDWDLSSGMIYISPRGQQILTGRAAEGGDVRHAELWARHYRLHPDDEPRRKAAVREHLAGRTPYYEGEWRVLHPDGTYHWVHSRGVCMRDASGRAVRFAGSSTDIDERKRGELALAESEARFRSLTELSSDFFWETDAEHRYTAIELGWAYTGVRNNVSKLGRARWDIPHASPDEVAWAAHRATIAGRERFVGFRFSRFEEGEERFYEHSGEPRYDAQGNFLGYRGVGRDVTERMRAEEALRESEKRYERVMLAAEAGFWEWDVPADEFYVSPKLLEMTDFPPGTRFAGRADFMTRAPFHPDDRTKWERAVKALFASGGTRLAMEIRSLHGGETRWAILSGMCVRDAAGKIVRWTGSATDITERKRMEASLTQSEERYARVMRASEDGFWEWIVATDEFYASPRMLALYGLPPDTMFRGRADFLSRFPFHPEDLPLWRNAVAAHLAGQSARVDVEVRANVQSATRWIHLTAICLRDASDAEERWTGSVSDVTARRRAQEALRRSEERYAHAMEGSDAGHWDWNIVSDEMFVSERAREMLALPAGPLPARRADIMERVPMHPEDRAAMADVVKAGIESGIHERDYRVIPRGGEVRWLRSRGKIYKDAGGAAVRMTGSLIDITERKLAADALRASEERYSLAMNASEEGHFDFNADTDALFISERLNQIYGFPPGTRFRTREEYLKAFRFYENDGDTYAAAVGAAMAKDGPARYEFEYRIVRPSGEVRWLRTRGKVARDAEGRALRRTGVVADITETKRAEDALRESQDRYERAMEATEAGHWEWDLVTHQVFHSPRFRELYGISPEETFADRDAWKARQPVSASERERQERALQAAIADPTKIYDIELSFEMRPGEVRWLRSRGKVFRAEDGRALRVTGATTDITARKLAEEALRLSEERYALAVAGSDDGVWDVDFSARRVFVSARGRELAGMPPGPETLPMEEFFGGLPLHPEDVERRNAAFQAHLAGEMPAYVGEFRLRQPDGVYRWRRLRGLCVRDANGKPQRMAGSISDIDARKRAEDSLRMSGERYALAMEAAGDGHTDWNLVTGEFYISPRLLEILGYAPDTTFADRADWVRRFPFHPEDRAKWEAAIAEHFAGREAKFRMDLRIVVKGEMRDETRWVAFTFIATRDAAGKPVRWTGSIADINDAKLAEEARRLSEERYALAMRASGAGHWDWKIASDEFYASPRYLEFGGFPPDVKYLGRADIVSRIPFHPDDKAQYEAAVAAHFAGETPCVDRVIRVVPHGETRWLHVIGTCLRDSDGKPVRWAGSVTDITARKLAEEALRLSEKRYALAMEVADEGHFDWNVQTDEIFASARALSVIGASPQAKYRTRSDVTARVRYHPDDDARIRKEWRAALDGPGVDHEFEYRILRGEAQEPRWIRGRWKVFRDEAGVALRVIGVITDITERKLAADELRQSEVRFRALTGISSDWYWRQDENLRFTYLSEGASERAGWPGDVYLGRLRWEVPDIHLISCSWDEHKEVLAKRQPFRDLEYWRPGKDGGIVYSSISGAPIFDEQGQFKGYHGVGRNITERKRTEEELRSRQEMLDLAQRSARVTAFEWKIGAGDGENRWSPDLEAMYGLEPGTYDGSFESWKKLVHPEDWPAIKEALRQAHRSGEIAAEYRVVHRDGSVHWLQAKGRMFFDAAGKPARMVGFMHDTTERKRVEEALRQSEERYALAVSGSNEGIFDWDLVTDRVYVSHRAQELFGLPRGELWRPRRDWRHILNFHPQDAPRLHDGIKAHIEGGTPTYDVEFRIVLPDGGVRWYRQRGIALRDASGKAYRVVGSIGDVTEKHVVEEELKALERKLRLAQRLEAMGTLAGGIAHDFNNILGAILGYGEMAMRDAPKGSRLRRDLDSIVTAGERGRALVDRVLAFSRSGVGERVPVHVEKVVREALDLVSAKLPPDVTLHAKLHAGRAAMLGDATQVHQVLMNLASNAIQAMPAGGTLRVSLRLERLETARAPSIGILDPGNYLVLEVADTGTGIAPEILDRIFDPFFTTKEVGTGTGLGLSLVHGIVAEVGGAIDVASRLGAGSTFTVYLPRTGEAEDSSQREEPELPRGEGQRVLVVDDEEPLVKLATRTLQELGYAPVGFTSSTAALAAFRADPERFDALITDERMPGMSGSALIREVRGIRERIPIVLMSGYVGGAVATRAREAGAEEVLKKPLSARDLAASLARVLQA